MTKKIIILSSILALALMTVATIQGCGKAGETGSEELEFTLSGEAI